MKPRYKHNKYKIYINDRSVRTLSLAEKYLGLTKNSLSMCYKYNYSVTGLTTYQKLINDKLLTIKLID